MIEILLQSLMSQIIIPSSKITQSVLFVPNFLICFSSETEVKWIAKWSNFLQTRVCASSIPVQRRKLFPVNPVWNENFTLSRVGEDKSTGETIWEETSLKKELATRQVRFLTLLSPPIERKEQFEEFGRLLSPFFICHHYQHHQHHRITSRGSM